MRVARIGRKRFGLALGAALLVAAIAVAPSTASAAVASHKFKVLISPAYTTAGQSTTFEVTVANSSSKGTSLGSVQLTPPAGFALSRPTGTEPLRRKTLVQKRLLSLHQISVKPGASVRIPVTATAPTKCGKQLRWTSRAFEHGTASGPQLALQTAVSSVGVTVVCPAAAACGDGGPPCSTTLKTSGSTYAVISDASSGTLQQTLDVGTSLTCAGYQRRDPNWYEANVTPPSPQLDTRATAPLVDDVTYTIKNTTSSGIGFCLGAAFEFTTASGAQAPARALPNGKPGFIGLLPTCTYGVPPCISGIAEHADKSSKTGVDVVLSAQIPEGKGDPWAGG